MYLILGVLNFLNNLQKKKKSASKIIYTYIFSYIM